jgi:SAM-dependent methyltransferase
MNGGHQCAYDYILANVKGDERVLDLGAGYSQLAAWLAEKGCKVVAAAWDVKRLTMPWNQKYRIVAADVTTPEFWLGFKDGSLDLVIAKYSVMCMLGRQCYVWSEVARALKPGGRYIHCGRYRMDSPVYERDRDDPLLANNELTIAALAANCGMTVTENRLYHYEGEEFHDAGPADANAIISLITKD